MTQGTRVAQDGRAQAPTSGVFGPTALARLRAIRAQQEALEREANAVLAVVLEALGHDLQGTRVRARYDVAGDANSWIVEGVDPVPSGRAEPDPSRLALP
jgi:hypothetical protein